VGPIGAPQTSQKSSVEDVCPCGQTAVTIWPPSRIAQQFLV
jgi:hypothetical protein